MKSPTIMSAKAFSAAALACALVAAGAVPAWAVSSRTKAYISNLQPNINYLNAASRLALKRSSSARLRGFAHKVALNETIAGNSLVAWEQLNSYTPGQQGSRGSQGNGNNGGNGNGGNAQQADSSPGRSSSDSNTGRLLPSDSKDLDRLRSREGRSFDALYRTTQLDSLRQLTTLYRGYIDNGDNPTLKRNAQRQLSIVKQRLAELSRLRS